MRIVFILLFFIFIMGIFSCAYSKILKGDSLTNQSAVVHAIEEFNHENNNSTTMKTYNVSKTDTNKSADIDVVKNVLTANPDTGNYYTTKNLSILEVDEQSKREDALNEIRRNFKKRIEIIAREKYCTRKSDLYKNLNSFSFRSFKDHQELFLTFQKNSSGELLICSLSPDPFKQGSSMGYLTWALVVGIKEFEQFEIGIICNTSELIKSCRQLENVNFHQKYKIDSISKHLRKLDEVNDCQLRVLNLMFNLIKSHGILADECNSPLKKLEALYISSALIPSINNLIIKIDSQTMLNATKLEVDCNMGDKSCITTKNYNELHEYYNNFTQKLNENYKPPALGCVNTAVKYQKLFLLILILFCLLFYYRMGF